MQPAVALRILTSLKWRLPVADQLPVRASKGVVVRLVAKTSLLRVSLVHRDVDFVLIFTAGARTQLVFRGAHLIAGASVSCDARLVI